MKKSLILSIPVIILPLILSGCSKSQPKETNIFEAESNLYVKKTGTFEKLLTPIDDISYVLAVQNEKKYLLKSIFVDLENPEYLNQKIEIIGPLYKGNAGKWDLLEVEKINVIASVSEAMSNNGNLAEFTSTSLEFQIAYDSNLKFKETSNGVNFYPQKENNTEKATQLIEIIKENNPQNLSLEDWITQSYPLSRSDLLPGQIGKTAISAMKTLSSNPDSVSFFIKNADKIFTLRHISNNPQTKNEIRTIFYEMIYTFEFLNNKKIPNLTNKTTAAEQDQAESPKAESKDSAESNKPQETLTTSNNTEDKEKNDSNSDSKSENTAPIETNSNNEKSSPLDSTNKSVSEDYQFVIAYLQENFQNFLNESDKKITGWRTDQFEFVQPNLVYLQYSATNNEKRKLLFLYDIKNNLVTVQPTAYYIKGEDKDWQKISGSDPAVGKSKEIIDVSAQGEAVKKAEISAGNRYFESSKFKFKMQIPMNWYYQGQGGHYSFSAQPVTAENQIFSLDILQTPLSNFESQGQTIEINGKKAIIVTSDNSYSLYLQKSDGRTYKLTSAPGMTSTVTAIANSIQD